MNTASLRDLRGTREPFQNTGMQTTRSNEMNTHRRFPVFDRTTVLRHARRYWQLIKPAEYRAEKEIEAVMPAWRNARELDHQTFLLIAQWKSCRPRQRYLGNTDHAVRSATSQAFRAATDAEAIDALRGLNGVALRTATALLHWMRPEQFPILDYRVVAALGMRAPSSWEDTAFYSKVADRLRAISADLNVDLRTLDRALWAWDKSNPAA